MIIFLLTSVNAKYLFCVQDPMTKVLAVRVPNELYSEFCNYKQKMKFSSDSEALRDILRRFLLEGDDNNA